MTTATLPSPAARPLAPKQIRQIIALTVGAVVLFIGGRLIPTGTDLHRTDFDVAGGGAGDRVIEFCDPANPQFLPVVAMRSPVTMSLAPDAPLRAGEEARFTLRLATASGKPIAPVDLLVAHTRKLHLMVVDPTLDDYHHIHPEPGETPGEWIFAVTPREGGIYRVFADFTPTVTARGLYASADFTVPSAADAAAPAIGHQKNDTYEADGLRFTLRPDAAPIRSREQARLTFTVERSDGGAVGLEPVMDAYAHLVAFDESRSGFAHLHPEQVDLDVPPDALRPTLTFRITIPEPGSYVIWAQVNVRGEERYAPFWFEVAP